MFWLVGVHHRQERVSPVGRQQNGPAPLQAIAPCVQHLQGVATWRQAQVVLKLEKAGRWPCPEHQRGPQGVRQHPTRLRGKKVGLHRQQPIRQGFLTHCLGHVVVLQPTIFLPRDFKQELVVAQAPSDQREFQRLAGAEALQGVSLQEPCPFSIRPARHAPSGGKPLSLVDHPHFGRVPVAAAHGPIQSLQRQILRHHRHPSLAAQQAGSLVDQTRPHPVRLTLREACLARIGRVVHQILDQGPRAIGRIASCVFHRRGRVTYAIPLDLAVALRLATVRVVEGVQQVQVVAKLVGHRLVQPIGGLQGAHGSHQVVHDGDAVRRPARHTNAGIGLHATTPVVVVDLTDHPHVDVRFRGPSRQRLDVPFVGTVRAARVGNALALVPSHRGAIHAQDAVRRGAPGSRHASTNDMPVSNPSPDALPKSSFNATTAL